MIKTIHYSKNNYKIYCDGYLIAHIIDGQNVL